MLKVRCAVLLCAAALFGCGPSALDVLEVPATDSHPDAAFVAPPDATSTTDDGGDPPGDDSAAPGPDGADPLNDAGPDPSDAGSPPNDSGNHDAGSATDSGSGSTDSGFDSGATKDSGAADEDAGTPADAGSTNDATGDDSSTGSDADAGSSASDDAGVDATPPTCTKPSTWCDGVCQPGACVITMEKFPGEIAVNQTDVFWTESSSPDAGSGFGLEATSGVGAPAWITVPGNTITNVVASSAAVFSTDGYSLFQTTLGGATTAMVVGANQYGLSPMALDTSNVYWTNRGSGSLVQIPLTGGDGGTGTTLGAFSTTSATPASIALNSTSVYWITNGGDVLETPIGGGTTTTIFTGTHEGRGIAVDSTGVYFTNAQFIAKCPLTGCVGNNPTWVITQANTGAIVSDGVNVYWTSSGVYTTPVDGATATLFAASSAPMDIAIDDTNVYWTDTFAGVSKQAKF